MARKSAMTGGKKLDAYLRGLRQTLKNPGDSIEVGFFKGDRYPEDQGGELVAHVAQSHEFGLGNQRRPFFRQAISALERNAELDRELKQMIGDDGKIKAGTHERIGELAANTVKLSILQLRHPPNNPARIDEKGSANPLVDTRFLIDMVKHRRVNR